MGISLHRRILAFSKLGAYFRNFKEASDVNSTHELNDLISSLVNFNPWFTRSNVTIALESLGLMLDESKLITWIKPYEQKIAQQEDIKRVGVVMAGNIPLVGFHDFITVLMSGHKVICKLSSDDDRLLPAIIRILVKIEPDFKNYIEISDQKLQNFDAVIATGSNNTSRYFEYYFGKYPHIIRKNRNGIAILQGNETDREIELMGEDIFNYFGMGCRSLAKVFVPREYDFEKLFKNIEKFSYVRDHSKYMNNYDYYKSIFLINGLKHFDNWFLLVKEDVAYASPPSVLYFESYTDLESVRNRFGYDADQIQCVVGTTGKIPGEIPFGKSQQPELWDYADNVDTMQFLATLN
ncbi:MAG: hypothetical protein JW731_07995 [Bacteroidales bacterium]|nr:hypothetical protein [Bacteroidales bacterium]